MKLKSGLIPGIFILLWIFAPLSESKAEIYDTQPYYDNRVIEGNEWVYLENGTDIVTQKVIRGTYNVNGKPTKVLEILGGELSGTKIYLNADIRGIHKHRVYSQDLFMGSVVNSGHQT